MINLPNKNLQTSGILRARSGLTRPQQDTRRVPRVLGGPRGPASHGEEAQDVGGRPKALAIIFFYFAQLVTHGPMAVAAAPGSRDSSAQTLGRLIEDG